MGTSRHHRRRGEKKKRDKGPPMRTIKGILKVNCGGFSTVETGHEQCTGKRSLMIELGDTSHIGLKQYDKMVRVAGWSMVDGTLGGPCRVYVVGGHCDLSAGASFTEPVCYGCGLVVVDVLLARAEGDGNEAMREVLQGERKRMQAFVDAEVTAAEATAD